MPPTPEQQKWLLQFTSPAANPTGAPWGDLTAVAMRQKSNLDPWDTNCRVTTLVGGYAAMSAMRDALERAITEGAASANKAGDRGYVYICDWRLNAFRDTSSINDWLTGPWSVGGNATTDQTVIGLVLRLMQAGVQVRILIWLPWSKLAGLGFAAHIEDHAYIASMVQAENERLLRDVFPGTSAPLGIVTLDRRIAGQVVASHHQKMMVIQGLSFQVAFCGGVDLAYTRRDAPAVADAAAWQYDHDPPKVLNGDWQTGGGIPDPANMWPFDPAGGVVYNVNAQVSPPADRQGTDLPVYVYGDGVTAQTQQVWHDQHLQLEGPIVTTLEEQFRERWADSAGTLVVIPPQPGTLSTKNWRDYACLSTTDAIDTGTNTVKPLRPATPVPAPASNADSTVQMWRTIPWRAERSSLQLSMGEFTVMAGYARACQAATELIWIFDQYFWSRPLARLLNSRLKQTSSLRLVMILPPFADMDSGRDSLGAGGLDTVVHHARQLALEALTDGLSQTGGEYDQVAIYNLWDSSYPRDCGIYCHAKTQTYDGSLMVCGSANLNRRSLLGDSEIACAVLDSAVVNHHQRKVWSLLFPKTPWPTYAGGNDVDLSVKPATGAGPGATFFSAFTYAQQHDLSFLIPDPWRKGPDYRLPNGVLRSQDPPEPEFKAAYVLLEATSVELERVEAAIWDGTPDGRDPDLSDIVRHLGNDSKSDHNGEVSWRFRRPPGFLSPPGP